MAGIVAVTGLAVMAFTTGQAHNRSRSIKNHVSGYTVGSDVALRQMDKICASMSGGSKVVSLHAEPWFARFRSGPVHTAWLIRGSDASGSNNLVAQIDATTGYLLSIATHPDFRWLPSDKIGPVAAASTARAWITTMGSYLPRQNWRLVSPPERQGPRWRMDWEGEKVAAEIHVDSCNGGVAFATFRPA
jgi:hypothetical protein